MKYFITFIILCAIGSRANSQKVAQDDGEMVKQVLLSYFDGIGTRNTRKMSDVVTHDFFLYEEGKVWTNDSVFNEMRTFPYAKAHFKFENFRVSTDENSAYMAYYEQANFFMNDSTKLTLNFLGSAAFKRINGEWKMSFLHSDARYLKKKK